VRATAPVVAFFCVPDSPAVGFTLGALGSRDANPVATHRDYSSILQIRAMSGEHFLQQSDPLCSRHIGQAQEAAVTCAFHKKESAEILVHGDQNPLLTFGPAEKLPVSWVGPSFPGLGDIEPLRAKPFGEAMSGTTIDQKLH
jgi:hypothetical protein